jgi:hypothetical protein
MKHQRFLSGVLAVQVDERAKRDDLHEMKLFMNAPNVGYLWIVVLTPLVKPP